MKFKGILPAILALCLLLSACGQAAPPPTAEPVPAPEASEPISIPQDNLGYSLGQTIPDFSFTDYEGKAHSLYETLSEKELVLINIWATWCSPCGMEFPYMEEAYQLYKDRVEIFALSCESGDTDEILAQYAADMGISFPVGRDSSGLAASFMAYSIPTTVAVDRYGTVCAIEVGAKTSAEAFTSLFEEYLGADYEGYIDPNAPVCDIAPASPDELNAAANVPGGELSFGNMDSKYIWPMLPGEKDSRSVLVSTNQGIAGTASAVKCTVSARHGDVLSLSFALSGEEALDLMKLYVNGDLVKSFGGEKGWMTYAYPFPADGDYEIVVCYEKNSITDEGEDSLWVDSIAILSGDQAEAALEANPLYATAVENSLVPMSPKAREIVFDDPHGAISSAENAETMSFYIIPETEARFRLELSPGVDPEPMVFFSDYDGSVRSVISCAAERGYEVSLGIDSLGVTGYPYSMLYLEDSTGASGFHRIVTYFADEENLELFVRNYFSSDDGQPLVSWRYADVPQGNVEYCVRFVDIKGNAVPGVLLQVCDESLCQVFTSDENGECRFNLPPYAYELHILSLPEGYDTGKEIPTTAPENGGEVIFDLIGK